MEEEDNNNKPAEATTDTVPESLLALAKDARYLQACQELVHQVLAGQRSGAVNDDRFALEATMISSLLYLLLVVSRKKRTLGMEVTGLGFANESRTGWNYYVGLSSVATLFSYAVCRMARNMNRNDDNDDNHQLANSESLRGARRREYFASQRQAMLERAQAAADSSSNGQGGTLSQPINQSQRHTNTGRARMLIQWFSSLLSRVHASEGQPHTLPLQGEEIQQQPFQALSRIVPWIFRLHVALYCIHGKYPTWQQRLLGAPFERKQGEERLVNRPTTHRIVGLLILAQTVGATLTTALRLMVYAVADFYYKPSTMVPTRQAPSIDFGATTITTTLPATPPSQSSTAVCGICHQIRQYPACPVACGHVFCWTCLQQWITRIRPECPICRISCQSRHVLPLYNYYPPPNDDPT